MLSYTRLLMTVWSLHCLCSTVGVTNGLVGLEALNDGRARSLEFFGFYSAMSGKNVFPELVGSSNLVVMPHWDPNVGTQVFADEMRSEGLKLTLQVSEPLTSEALFTNENGARDQLFSTVHDKLYRLSDLHNSVAMIQLGDEWYSHLKAGGFNRWTTFRNSTDRVATMKGELEKMVADAKRYFPGIPIMAVDNFWDSSTHVPPSNLDVLGIDAYFVPTSPACDAAQKDLFDRQVTQLVKRAVGLDKPVLMIGGAFVEKSFVMPTSCQLVWYYDLATSLPEVIGLEWFLYANRPTIQGVRDFPAQRDSLLAMGRNHLRKP